MKVQLAGFTFISDSKDSKTVMVLGGGKNQPMPRPKAEALYRALRATGETPYTMPSVVKESISDDWVSKWAYV